MEPILLAFSARYLPMLVSCVRTLDRGIQPEAVSAYIQVLSLLPGPESNPYLRSFLRSSSASGFPSLIVWHFVQGLNWISPSGPGHICELITNLLFWCDVDMGNDKRAAIDHDLRVRLAKIIPRLQSQDATDQPRETRRLATERLAIILKRIESAPTDSLCAGDYLISVRQRLESSVPGQLDCFVCRGRTELLCSQCKSIRFCSKECQAMAWEDGHQFQCFTMAV